MEGERGAMSRLFIESMREREDRQIVETFTFPDA